MSAQDIIETEVRDIVRRQSLDPLTEREAVRRIVDDVVNRYGERSLAFTLPALADPPRPATRSSTRWPGYGAIQKYLDDPSVEEIWINEPSRVFVARNGRSELTTTVLTADEVRDLVERMLKSTGRRIDFSTPFVDAMLLDGSRLHVAIPDITLRQLGGQHPQVRRAGQLPGGPGRLRHPDPSGRPLPRGVGDLGPQRAGRRWYPGREDHPAQLPGLRGAAHRTGGQLRGGLRAQDQAARLGGDADPAGQPRGNRRDPPPAPGEGSAADAAEPDDRRRGPGRRSAWTC